jgi:hypothetical protein
LKWELGLGSKGERCAAMRPAGVESWKAICPWTCLGLVFRQRDLIAAYAGDVWSTQDGRRGRRNSHGPAKKSHLNGIAISREISNARIEAKENSDNYCEVIVSSGRKPASIAIRRAKFLAMFGQNSLAELKAYAEDNGMEVILL